MKDFDWRSTINFNIQLLRYVGLWPKDYELYKADLYLLYSVISTITIIGGHNLSQIINIFYVYNDLEALSGTIFIAATNLFAILKRYILVKNLETIKKLLMLLNTTQFKPRNFYQVKLIDNSVKKWKKSYIIFSVIVYTNLTLWSLVPILNGGATNYILPFEAWYPFQVNKFPNYGIVYIYQVICIWYITIANLNIDTFVYAFMMFIGAQCDILNDELKNLEDDDSFGLQLRSCICYHQDILRLVAQLFKVYNENYSLAKRSNEFFNYIIFGQIVTSTAALALALFQLSLADTSNGSVFASVMYVLGMSAEIFLYCWFGNEVEIKSNQISFSVYKSKWIGKNSSALKTVIILATKCQKPIKITAINLFTLSLSTFLNIIRSAWSYFAVLNTVNKK